MKEIVEAIRKNKNFYIFGHLDPDGDCIGSQLGLALFLRRMGKNVKLFSDGKFDRTDIKPFESYFSHDFIPFENQEKTLAIILDCSTPDRTGKFEENIIKFQTIVIDHHFSISEFGDFKHIDSTAGANTMLILELIEAFGENPSAEEANLLMLGLCTDTGFFKHLTSTGYKAFETAAKLTKAGASPNKIFYDINGNRKLESRYHLAKVLNRAIPFFNGKLIITHEKKSDFNEISPESRDIDTVYMLFLGTENVMAVANIKEDDGFVTAGLRTRSENIDLSQIAQAFNGGGHKKAAGFRADGTIEEITAKLLLQFSAVFKKELS